jgi:hypothetical protein
MGEGGGAFPHDRKKYGGLPCIFLFPKESLRTAMKIDIKIGGRERRAFRCPDEP